MNMKKSTILKSLFITAFIILGFNLSAQEVLMPVGLHEHGKNSADAVVPSENTDSVTVGSALQYWVQPDALFIGTTSTFTWSISGLGAVGVTTTNLTTVTFGVVSGLGTINVAETSPIPSSCPGSTRTINFNVIKVPTADFGIDPAAQCASAAALTFTLPITVTTDIAGASPASAVKVIYTVYDKSNAAVAGLSNISADLSAGAARTLTVVIPAGSTAGTYYAKISSITDRISRKPAIDIEGAFAVNNDRIDLVVNPVPVTGPIFHVPNM